MVFLQTCQKVNRVALRDDAPALALRGIAMAQLGDLVRARALLRSASRAFGAHEAVARARCVVAEAEIALALRELAWPTRRFVGHYPLAGRASTRHRSIWNDVGLTMMAGLPCGICQARPDMSAHRGIDLFETRARSS